MTGEPKDPREEASRELAERLATPEGLRLARLLQSVGALASPAPAPSPAPEPGGPRPISIWQPMQEGGQEAGETVFVRPDLLPLGDHYATRRKIPAQRPSGTRRILLFGESVAAGYLYAPHQTPATVLAAHLRELAGAERYDVIDLAKTNETLPSLLATVEAALQLAPDLLILFAGNNWTLLETPDLSPYAPTVAARQTFAAALRAEGLAGPARLARQRLAELTSRALIRLATLAGAVPVLLLLPEVNLADWQTLQPAPWLPGGSTARWHRTLARGLDLLQRGDATGAEAAAWEMIELDGGLTPTPFRLLASALAAAGRHPEARDAALSEVDAVHYPLLACLAAPQAGTPARETLRRAAAHHNFTALDLRPLFAEVTPSSLPGRRLFLDYCHLTTEGIHLAMAATAAEVLRLAPPLGPYESAGTSPGLCESAGTSPSETAGTSSTREGGSRGPAFCEATGAPSGARRSEAERPAPRAGGELDESAGTSSEVEALARLGAAIHTAHRLLTPGPKSPHLQPWIDEALAASPRIADTLLGLVTARASLPLPAVLTAAQTANLASPYRLLLQHGWRWDHLDPDLIEAVVAALEAAGRPARREVEDLLVARHAQGGDLSRAPYLWEPLARFYPEAMEVREVAARAMLRAPWPETCFCLVADGQRPVQLDLTARLPPIPGVDRERTGEAEIALDGHSLATIPLTTRWSRTPVQIASADLRRGLNRLTLRWPPPPPWGDEALEAAIRRLESGIEADLHPIFGEVFSLLARPL